jgi:putative transposase
MIRFAFKKGLRFLCNAKAFTLMRRLASGKFQLEGDSGEATTLSEKELHGRWANGEWQIDPESLGASSNVFYYTTPKDLKAFPEEDQVDAKRKMNYLNGIRKLFECEGKRFVSTPEQLEPKIAEVAAEIKDEKTPPTPLSVWRWWKLFSPTQCITKLVERTGRAGRPIDAVHRSIFDEAVCEVFLTPQKMPGKAVVDAVETKFERINQGVPEADRLKAPSRATVYRWLKTLYYEVVKKAREGKAATLKELRSVVGAVKVDRILERVELDHTPLDILVICQITKMILGRPWLTLAIDRFSRMILGFYISFHAPSGTSVLYCLRMMIMPKEQLLERYPDVVGPWPGRGIPDTAVTDNGMDLHADAVETICLEIGIELQYCGVARPEMKGAIERAIGTVNRTLIHTLPGTTFSNVQQRGDYDSEQHAALDIEVLTHVLVKWIVDVYHKTPHRGLGGRTPLNVWQAGEADRTVELPAFPRQLEAIVGHAATRTLFHYGVEHDNLRYNSPLLQTIKQRDGGTPIVQLRGFEHDVGYVAVFDPNLDEFIDVPAVDQAYAAGLNRHVHRLVCAEARKRFGDRWTASQLREVKIEIQAIVDDAIRAKKTGTRKAAAVATLTDSEQVFHEESADALARACELMDTALQPTAPIDPGADDELPVFKKSSRIEEEVTA